MIGFFENLLRVAAEELLVTQQKKEKDVPTDVVQKGKYDVDVAAIEGRYGDLNGQTINIELQQLLALAPRDRRRIEAYNGLRTHLRKQYNCTLNITSRKTK